MTYAARRVLSDCRLARELLEAEERLDVWRVHWVAAVGLARAVGHVLQKVDGEDEGVSQAASKLFKEWKSSTPEHAIFRDFIEAERNVVLKQYQPTFEQSATILAIVDGFGFDLDETLFRPMTSGPWVGEDARDVLQDAIDWWSVQLDRIDLMSSDMVANLNLNLNVEGES